MCRVLAVFGLVGILIGSAVSMSAHPTLEKAMNEQYQTLLEKDKILEVVNQLFISTDRRDWARVKQLFSVKVLFDMTSMAGGEPTTLTPQDIVDAWERGLKPLRAIHHQVGNYVININQDAAEVFCYGIASHYLPNKTNRNTRTFVGSYDFHLRKDAGTWRIDRFKFDLKYIDGNPDLEASVE